MLQQFYPTARSHAYRYELNKDMDFSSAHFIPVQSAGKCQNVHGHTYFVNITIAGDDLDEAGFLVNFSTIKKLIHGEFDHSVINDKMNKIPSTEQMAEEIYFRIKKYLRTLKNKPVCLQVLVRETPSSYVTYRPKVGDAK